MVDRLSRRRFAILRQIGFQQIALRLGFAFQRAKLYVLAVGRRGLFLQLIEAGGQILHPAAGDPRIVLERARQLHRLIAELLVEIGQLRLQFLDPRMTAEQRRALFGELRAKRDPLLRQPTDQFGVQHFRSFDRAAALQHLLDQPGLGFGIGLQRTGVGELGIDVAELLVRQRGVVGADEQARLGAEVLDLVFGLRHLLAQRLDLAGQPLPCRLGLRLTRILLQHQIAVRDRIGDARSKLGIFGLEFDHHHPRLVDRIRGQPLIVSVQHALFRSHCERIAADADQRQQRFDRIDAFQHRIEFRPLGELVLLDDLERELARQQQLNLAGHRFRVRAAALIVAIAARTQEGVLAAVDQDSRLGFVARRDQVHDRQRDDQRKQRRRDDQMLFAGERLPDQPHVDVAVRRQRCRLFDLSGTSRGALEDRLTNRRLLRGSRGGFGCSC